jgi:hypothetical protein
MTPCIDLDLPCYRCGYDLRGLTPPGRCPECGHALEHSVEAWRRRRAPLPPPDEAWLARVRSGAWCSIVTFGLLLATVLAVPQYVEWYRLPVRNAPIAQTPQRVLLLCVACAWWVLAWASVWRLTASEGLPGRHGVAFVAGAARWANSTLLLMPFAWALVTWRDWDRAYTNRSDLVPFVFAALAGGFFLLVHVGLLAWRLRVRRLRAFAVAEACALALLVPASGMLAWIGTRDDNSTSLSMMFELPAFPYGAPAVLQWVVRSPLWRSNDPLRWAFLAVPLWSLSLIIRLLIWARPRERRS